MNCKIIHNCRLCDHPDLMRVLDFGATALANAYPTKPDAQEDLYLLSVAKCQSCGHVQLEQTVTPEVLFRDYLYSSSDSPALVAHFHEFANSVSSRLVLNDSSRLLEIGCNDGGLLREFARCGVTNLYGVDPAVNLAGRARSTGAAIWNEFLTVDLARQIRDRCGPMHTICATNVFAHIADIVGLVNAITELLSDHGVFVFENAYLADTIQGLYFDQIYHEHLQYFGVKPLVRFFTRFGLEIFDVERTPSQGGSIRVFVKRTSSRVRPVSSAVHWWLEEEHKAELYEDETYKRFECSLQAFIVKFDAMMKELGVGGATFSCYGCPAKFTLLSKLLGLHRGNVKYVVDDSPIKQGRFSPGQKIPIVDNTHFRLNPTDYCIVTAWNMIDAIIARNPCFRGEWVNPYSGVVRKRKGEAACHPAESGVKSG